MPWALMYSGGRTGSDRLRRTCADRDPLALVLDGDDDPAAVLRGAVLEQVDRLPGAERELAALHRHGDRRRGDRRSDVPAHVVGPLVGVAVPRVGVGGLAGEPVLQV